MKKALAVLLAVLMAFSVCVVCVSAEGDSETTGTVYTIPSTGLGRINVNTDVEVLILKGGDRIEFGTVTAKTTEAKPKIIEVYYYPDAASIKSSAIKNPDWKNNVVPKYNLDSEKWQLKEGETAADLMAKSPNYYKTFNTSVGFQKGDVAVADILGLNGAPAHAKDSAGVERGDLENGNPIDYALPGAKFVGWALYKNGTWDASKTDKVTVELYALWDRGAAPEEKPDDKPDNPDEPTEYATPIQETLAKWLAKIAEIFDYLTIVNAVPGGLAKLLNDGVRSWLYQLFGIEA